MRSFGDMLQIKVDRQHIKFLGTSYLYWKGILIFFAANNEMEEAKISINNKVIAKKKK
jgi:threonine/homoserine/homoserine lactone efflux protein